ncbi:MAG: hypothetical protein K2Y32_12490 [Candidatus Obscuribacterales bacterium]|nr:hypothetical protein [Candidatus Obscuribacterales bacterium]
MKAKVLFITCLMTVDAFFIGFAYSFNTHPVLIEDPSLPAKQIDRGSTAGSGDTSNKSSSGEYGPSKTQLSGKNEASGSPKGGTKAKKNESKRIKQSEGKSPKGTEVQDKKALPKKIDKPGKANKSDKSNKPDRTNKSDASKSKPPEKIESAGISNDGREFGAEKALFGKLLIGT